ncbi:MAG: ATP-binding protein [Magnetococcales bacterium]|nr:ATP-binding protein [Magnetococcales bacterium]
MATISGGSGGSGTSHGMNFQYSVAAWFALHMFLKIPFGEEFGIRPAKIRRIGLETQAPVDDIILSLESGGFIFIQAKCSLELSKRDNSPFHATIGQFVRQYLRIIDQDFVGAEWARQLDPNKDRLILAVDLRSSEKIKNTLMIFLDQVGNKIDASQSEEEWFGNNEQKQVFNVLKKCLNSHWKAHTSKELEGEELHNLLKLIKIYSHDDLWSSNFSSSPTMAATKLQTLVVEEVNTKAAVTTLIQICSEMAQSRVTAGPDYFANRLSQYNLNLIYENKNFISRPRDRVNAYMNLPVSVDKLFGRETDMNRLDELWQNRHKHNVVAIIAEGGVGKSALVYHWLRNVEQKHMQDIDDVFAVTFYSQGTNDRNTSADMIIRKALLEWFNETNSAEELPMERGKRLARLFQKKSYILVLDGLEPLQISADNTNLATLPEMINLGPNFLGCDLPGMIKDPTLAVFLGELIKENPGLCIITTRQPFLMLPRGNVCGDEKFVQIELSTLTAKAGADLLDHLRVIGTSTELGQLSSRFGNHALALKLLASYLYVFHEHRISGANGIPIGTNRENHPDKHARRILAAFSQGLMQRGSIDILEILHILGLFDRPADRASLKALRSEPYIPGLTETVFNFSEDQWIDRIVTLRKWGLINTDRYWVEQFDHDLDTHPIIREHFSEKLSSNNPSAWKAGHDRLYNHLASSVETFPSDMDGLFPLYASIPHGCYAEHYHEVYHNVFRRRIQRGNNFYSYYNLGAYGSDLAALSCFLTNNGTDVISIFSENDQSEIWNLYGYQLRGIGRTDKAKPMLLNAKSLSLQANDFRLSSINCESLSEILVFRGEYKHAISIAREGMSYIGSITDDNIHNYRNSYNDNRPVVDIKSERTREIYIALATALFESGNVGEAFEAIKEAENIYRGQSNNRNIVMDFIGGFVYSRILIEMGNYDTVIDRANQTMIGTKDGANVLSIGLNNLSLGCAYLRKMSVSGRNFPSSSDHAEKYFNVAVNNLRKSRNLEYLPFGLLARAEFSREMNKLTEATDDVEDVIQIASYGNMRLHLVGATMEKTKISMKNGNLNQARMYFNKCKEMADETKPHRRESEIDDLEIALSKFTT